jgi:RND family efflux transporter MFP subunit
MKHIVAWMTLASIMALTACSSPKQETASQVIPVGVGKVHHCEEYETVVVSGTIVSPDAPAGVAFVVSGKVVHAGPREGDYVKKGQILASIDPVDYQLGLAASRAQTETAEVAYRRAEDEHRRMKMLYDSKSLAPNDYQKYKSAYEAAKQSYLQAAASQRLSGKRLADATLRAPFNGFISKRSVEPGQMASPGQPAFELVKLDPVEINVGVPETDVHLIRTGQKTAITLPALPGESFEGTIRLINVSADSATRTFMTRITTPNPGHKLRLGMIAEARIRGDRLVKALTVPVEAVTRDPQGATIVFVHYPDRKRVYARRVEVGAVFGKEIELRKGLTGDESVVLAGQERLREGSPVSTATPEVLGSRDKTTGQEKTR